MRKVTLAILGWMALQAAPAGADGWCWASRQSCPGCAETRASTPRERWVVSRDEAYHEIFGDGPSRGSGRRRRRKSAAKAPAAAASPAPAPVPDAAPPPPADGAAQK